MTTATSGGDAPVAPTTVTPSAPAPENTTPISARDAARALSQARWEKQKRPEASEPAPQEPAAEPPKELAATPTDDPPQEAHVETTDEQSEPAQPPIVPPGSWTKEEKERFQTYPRELQAYLSEREQQRDRSVRQSQNEAAEKLKAVTAQEQAAAQLRQQYEQVLPQLMHTLQEQQAGQFADIKSQADVDRMTTEDPLRYLQWTAHHQKVAAVQKEMQVAQERQAAEYKNQWNEFVRKQDKILSERLPELADKARASKIGESAVEVLRDLGFDDQEMRQLWNGEASLSLRDARIQHLLVENVRFREGQELAKKAVSTPKPLPPVQKPGTAPQRGASAASTISNLSAKLDQTGSIKDAAALLTARRAAQRK